MWWGGDDLEVEGGVAFQRVRRHTGRLRPRVVFGLVFAESTLIALVAQMAHTYRERERERDRERDIYTYVCSHSRVATCCCIVPIVVSRVRGESERVRVLCG